MLPAVPGPGGQEHAMSELLWDHGVFVSTYVGPPRETPELPRKRVQIHRRGVSVENLPDLNDVITLSLEQWRDICDAVALLGPDCEGEEL
jgi:hypothetical protein